MLGIMGVMIAYPSALALSRSMAYFVVARRARAISATTFGGTVCAAAAGNWLAATMRIIAAARYVNARMPLTPLSLGFGIRIRMDFPDLCNRVARNFGQPGSAGAVAGTLYGNLHRTDAIGLSAPDPDRGAALGEHDSVGFHPLAHLPRKPEVGHLLGCWRAGCHHLQSRLVEVDTVSVLRQESAPDRAHLEPQKGIASSLRSPQRRR